MRSAHIYYAYDAIADFGLAVTCAAYAPYLMSLGLSLGEVSLLNSVFWFIAIFSELPTGMLADGKSRAWSLKMGCAFLMFGGIAYFFASGFWTAAIGEALIGIGLAFLSGAEQAWITDALHREGRDHERRRVFATAGVIRGLVMVIGGTIGAFIAIHHARFIWMPMMFSSPLALLVVHKFMNGQGEPIHKMSEREALRASIDLLKKSRSLVWVIFAMIVFGAVVSFNHFWSPYFKPYVGTMGLSWVWAIIYIACALSALWVRKLNVAQGNESGFILVALLITGIGLCLAGTTNGLWMPLSAAALHEFGRGMFNPLVDSFVQHRVESGFRATFGSLQSLLGRVGLAIAPLLIWLMIRHEPNTQATIGFVWFACGIVMIIGTLLLAFLRPRK